MKEKRCWIFNDRYRNDVTHLACKRNNGNVPRRVTEPAVTAHGGKKSMTWVFPSAAVYEMVYAVYKGIGK